MDYADNFCRIDFVRRKLKELSDPQLQGAKVAASASQTGRSRIMTIKDLPPSPDSLAETNKEIARRQMEQQEQHFQSRLCITRDAVGNTQLAQDFAVVTGVGAHLVNTAGQVAASAGPLGPAVQVVGTVAAGSVIGKLVPWAAGVILLRQIPTWDAEKVIGGGAAFLCIFWYALPVWSFCEPLGRRFHCSNASICSVPSERG